MFSPEEVLQEHGLVGAFDTMAMMHDEELAIIFMNDMNETQSTASSISFCDLDSADHDLEKMEEEVEEEEEKEIISEYGDSTPKGITYLELQMASQELAAHLYHRFGVRKGDPVAVLCHGHAAAEVTSDPNITSHLHICIQLLISISAHKSYGSLSVFACIQLLIFSNLLIQFHCFVSDVYVLVH